MQSCSRRMRWQFFSLLSLLSLVLAACGGPTSNQPTTTTSTTPSGSTEASGTATSDAAGVGTSAGADTPRELKLNPEISGTIDFWHHYGSPVRRNAINRVLAICKQQLPNIQVNNTFKPFGEGWTAMIAAVASGSGMPDVIVEDLPKLPERAFNNVDQPLQAFAERDGLNGSQFWPFAWQQTLYEGKTYGIPWETDVRVLFYNKSLFKEAGLDPNKPPRTWEEVEQYADKLDKKNPDGTFERIGFFPTMNIGPDAWGYTNDANWYSEDGTKINVNTPQAVETMQWIKKWVDRYGGWQNIQNFRASFQAPPNDAFMSGKVAMLSDINGYSSQLNFFRPKYNGADLEWGVSDLPYNTDKASWSGGFALSIPRGAKNPDAAWEFIKCATGPDAQASWARDTYAIPANKEAANDPVLLADPNWQLFVDAMNYTTGGAYFTPYPIWYEQLDQRYERMWRGELDPATALKEAQDAIDREMSQ